MSITKKAVQKTLNALVAEDPNRSNNGKCKYIVNDEPNCVAAVALDALGVDVAPLVDFNATSLDMLVQDRHPVVTDLTKGAAALLHAWQAKADSFVFTEDSGPAGRSRTWGEVKKLVANEARA